MKSKKQNRVDWEIFLFLQSHVNFRPHVKVTRKLFPHLQSVREVIYQKFLRISLIFHLTLLTNLFLNYRWINRVFIYPNDLPYYSTKLSPLIEYTTILLPLWGANNSKFDYGVFFDIFIWLDRARQVLQECVYWKCFRPFLWSKVYRETLCSVFFFNYFDFL
jgi:hypothetical protein